MTATKFKPKIRKDDVAGDRSGGESNRLFVFALLFVVVLAVAGIFLVRSLVDMVRLQDCAITGRQNC